MGSTLALGGGGLGIGGIILLLALNYLGGGDLTDVLSQIDTSQIPIEQIDTKQFEGADQYEVFVSTVLGSANDMWGKVFAQNNLEYRQPKLVLFRNGTQSACGVAQSAVGPHYCPEDETIYLDETFFDELQSRFKAKGGDVAQAYVIAHEVGHHVQKQLGIFDQVDTSDNDESVKTELQADCFSGLWAYSVRQLNVFESDQEINEALDAAAAVGDDRIQAQTEGQVNPETWTHGSSEQRMSWFNNGYNSGQVSACDTFK